MTWMDQLIDVGSQAMPGSLMAAEYTHLTPPDKILPLLQAVKAVCEQEILSLESSYPGGPPETCCAFCGEIRYLNDAPDADGNHQWIIDHADHCEWQTLRMASGYEVTGGSSTNGESLGGSAAGYDD